MLSLCGRTVTRFWPVLLALWAGAIVWLEMTAPSLDAVTQSGEFEFLPDDTPTRVGERLFNRAFPNDITGSSVVLVAYREEQQLSDSDMEFINRTLRVELEELAKPSARSISGGSGSGGSGSASGRSRGGGSGAADSSAGGREDGQSAGTTSSSPDAGAGQAGGDQTADLKDNGVPIEELISEVRSPSDEMIGHLLVSADDQAAMVIVELKTDFLELRNRTLVASVEEVVNRVRKSNRMPSGLSLDMTGSAVLGRDIAMAKERSSEGVHFWTLALVIGLLILVFRAPLLVTVPLLTLFLAFKLSLKSLAVASGAGWIGLFDGIEVYTMVVAYGAGVDYSMFLCSRFREELSAGHDSAAATHRTVSRIGQAVTASALTEVFGIGMLTAASFGKLHQAGITIAFSLFIMLLAALTLTPSLLRMGGRRIFWPSRLTRSGKPGSPEQPDAREQPDASERLESEEREGTRLQETDPEHIDAARPQRRIDAFWKRIAEHVVARPWRWGLVTVALMLPLAVFGILNYTRLSYGLVSQLPSDAGSVQGLRTLSQHFAAGETGHVTVLLKNQDVDFTRGEHRQQISDLTQGLKERQEELKLADIRSVSKPLGITDRAEEAVAAQTTFQRLTNQAKLRAKGQSYYVSKAPSVRGQVTRLDLVLSVDPFRRETISHLNTLEEAVRNEMPEELRKETQITLIGPTASMRDLRSVAERDRVVINVLVVAVVLGVLILLSREFVVPVYLVTTVLLSYLVTLGATFLWAGALTDPNFAGLDWTVPLFLFTILVAVGVDYNIFLVSRIREEQQEHDLRTSIIRALTRTGAIISSCGLIMAGTFSSLMIGGELARMDQLGFALAVGMLLDTFVVRPVLVPAFLIIYGRDDGPSSDSEAHGRQADGSGTPSGGKDSAGDRSLADATR